MLLCGVDEAGRGSVIGPLVVAGIMIKKSKTRNLDEIGVRDSKKLTRKKRNALFYEILDIAEFTCVYKIGPKEIDESVLRNNLNKLEGRVMANIINHLEGDIAYIDSCDGNIERYTMLLRSHLNPYNSNVKIFAMHKADILNIAVSAASIIAKVIRDTEIENLQEQFHNINIGSGYPADRRTMEFINNLIQEKNNFPDFIRRSWSPVKNILEKKQKKIYDFF